MMHRLTTFTYSIMASSSPLNFANQDLRNRSFKGHNLQGADFSGCDIRGCNFSHALLQGANFERVRAGQTPKQFIPLLVVTVVVTLLSADAFSQMLFGVLGRTPAEGNWSYVIALAVSLAISGTFSGVRALSGTKSLPGRIVTIVSGAASGALLGFFYGGSTTNNNPRFAIAGAVLGGVVMAFVSFKFRRTVVAVAIASAGAVAGYGFAFFSGATAIIHLSVQQFVWGLVWGALSLGYISLTMNSLTLAVREIRGVCGTLFRGADLTNAKFDGARLENTDFAGAVGLDASHMRPKSQ
jgi:hypothetical protein